VRDPWFPIALSLIVLLAAWLGIFGPAPPGTVSWLQAWQPLIAASIASTVASIAAYIAFSNTSRSLRHAEHLEQNRRYRKHAATRAVLPLALSQVTGYAERSARALDELVARCIDEELPSMTAPENLVQPLPSETLKTLGEFIEYSDALDVNILEATVAAIQIHDSRLRDLIEVNRDPSGDGVVHQTQIESYMIDAASIFAGASANYDYARRRQSQLPAQLLWDKVINALTNMRYWDEERPRLYAEIERRKKLVEGPFEIFKIEWASII
jgi:hypothetical protein